jgi:hypothetical protein
MDILFFLKRRTEFIRGFYDAASEPFRERIRKIEAGEEPFAPPYSEDGDPPYELEWNEAVTSKEILGRSCISMLSAALQLYFKTWEDHLRIQWAEGEKKATFKNGFVQGYKAAFGQVLRLDWCECPVNFDILEQIVLARNDDQHSPEISTLDAYHREATRRKHPDLFFMSDSDKRMFSDPNIGSISWMSPRVHVSSASLTEAIDQVEMLAEWLEKYLLNAKYNPPAPR